MKNDSGVNFYADSKSGVKKYVLTFEKNSKASKNSVYSANLGFGRKNTLFFEDFDLF